MIFFCNGHSVNYLKKVFFNPVRGVAVWVNVGLYDLSERKKGLPQVLFHVLKSCEKSRFVFTSQFVMCSLAIFYSTISVL